MDVQIPPVYILAGSALLVCFILVIICLFLICCCCVYYRGIRRGRERGRRVEQRNSDRRVNRTRNEYQRIRRGELEAQREASRVNHGSNRYPDLTLVVPVRRNVATTQRVVEMSVERLIPESRNPETQDGSRNIDMQYGPRNTDESIQSRAQDGEMDTERTPLLQEQNVPS